MTPQPGTEVAARYRIAEAIGEGAMGVVYRARDKETGATVALKILRPEYAAREDARARFTREARVAAALRHPNAVAIYGFGFEADLAYLAMEFVAGRVLRSVMTETGLPLGQTFEIGTQLADVLGAAHRSHLVHRDIKPDNIFIETGSGPLRVRVVDFGLAFSEQASDSLGRMTNDGVLGGTPHYMSPEQCEGGHVTGASDVYAMGCLLFEMISGGVPFTGSLAEILTKHRFAPVPRLVARVAEPQAIPDDLDALVAAMMSKVPAERPAAEAVVRTLSQGPSALSTQRGRSSQGQDRASRMVARGQAETANRSTNPSADGEHPQTLQIIGFLELDPELELAPGSQRLCS